MNLLVVGATGATGRPLVEQLLNGGHNVKVIVRSPDSLPKSLMNHGRLTVITANLLDTADDDLKQHVLGCDAVASCLGHNPTIKGIFGHPRKIVTEATKKICEAIKANNSNAPVKFVLMNTSGNSNRDLEEPISFSQKCIVALLRILLPPHVDNEQAADYLRTEIGQGNEMIEWAAVRPCNLIDQEKVTGYEVHPSPIRSAIFDPSQTSRINVGHFMSELMTNDNQWQQWKGQMPVIYNKSNK